MSRDQRGQYKEHRRISKGIRRADGEHVRSHTSSARDSDIAMTSIAMFADNPRVHGVCRYTAYAAIRCMPLYGVCRYTAYAAIRCMPLYSVCRYTVYRRDTNEMRACIAATSMNDDMATHDTAYMSMS